MSESPAHRDHTWTLHDAEEGPTPKHPLLSMHDLVNSTLQGPGTELPMRGRGLGPHWAGPKT